MNTMVLDAFVAISTVVRDRRDRFQAEHGGVAASLFFLVGLAVAVGAVVPLIEAWMTDQVGNLP